MFICNWSKPFLAKLFYCLNFSEIFTECLKCRKIRISEILHFNKKKTLLKYTIKDNATRFERNRLIFLCTKVFLTTVRAKGYLPSALVVVECTTGFTYISIVVHCM